MAFAVLFGTIGCLLEINALRNDRLNDLVMVAVPTTTFVFSIGSALWVIRSSSKVFDRFHRGVGGNSITFDAKRYIHLIPLLIVHRAQNVSRLLSIPLGLLWLCCFLLSLFVRHSVNDYFKTLELSALMYAILVAVAYLSFVFACNIYLALAVGVLFRNRMMTRMIWRSRFVFDFIVVVFAMLG